jgi:Ran GTPase-activating protein (RanGAP) involved in mRNA processing and transport
MRMSTLRHAHLLLKWEHLQELSKAGKGVEVFCQHLTLGFCHLEDSAAQLLGDALSKNRRLEILNIWDNKISTMGGEGLGHGLQHNSTLKTLNIRSNDLGPKGALGIAKGLMHNKSLKNINVRYNWIGDDGAKAFAALLLSNNTVQSLDVSRNRICSDGAEAITKALWHNRSLHELNLSINRICDKGGLFIGSALAHNTSLRKLDITECIVGDAGCHAIFQSLGASAGNSDAAQAKQMRRKKSVHANHEVEVLKMRGNEIGDVGALTVGLALKVNQGLVTLDLSHNRIMDQGGTALATALERNKVLKTVTVSSNMIGDAGIKCIADALRFNSSLTVLDVSKNAESFKADVRGVLDNTTLVTFQADIKLVRAQMSTRDGEVTGFQQDVSNAIQVGNVERPAEIFPNLSLKLVSLHALDNALGHESPDVLKTTLGNFMLGATQLRDMSLARNGLRCDHIKGVLFTSVTFLDLSHNAIGNAGMEHLITTLASVKLGPRIRELDLTDNQIYKVPPMLGNITTLECLFLEGNPAMHMVALTAIQAGISAVTQWFLKWAMMQQDLANIAKGVIKSKQKEEMESPRGSSPQQGPRSPDDKRTPKDIGFCYEYPGVYQPIPCYAVFDRAARFPTKEEDPTPGPADVSPWVHKKEGEEYERIVFKDHYPRQIEGAPIAHTADLTDEQEQAVLKVRSM